MKTFGNKVYMELQVFDGDSDIVSICFYFEVGIFDEIVDERVYG